jgi:hypothetical protein
MKFLQQLFSLDYHCRMSEEETKEEEEPTAGEDETEMSRDFFDDENEEEGEEPSSLDDPTTCSSGVFNSSGASTNFSTNTGCGSATFLSIIMLPLIGVLAK